MTLRLRSFTLLLIAVITISGCISSQSVKTQPSQVEVQASASPFPTTTNLPATTTPLPLPTSISTPWATSLPLAQETTFVFISETIPDGTNFQPGQTFQKTWTIKNGGAQSWDKSFALVRISSSPTDETLGSSEKIFLSEEVKQGETIEIGVDLIAPTQNGQYSIFYQLQDATGVLIPNGQLWVTITVGNVFSSEVGGITVRFESATAQANEFIVDFCMSLPDGRAWFPEKMILTADQQQHFPNTVRTKPYGATTANKCFSASFSASISSNTSYQLSIGKVALPPEIYQEENCKNARTTLQAFYPELDFKCAKPNSGLWYTNLVLPSGMTEEQADPLIMDAMSNAIYGPWILNGSAP